MFLFEQTVLEDKQGTLVTVPTPVTEAEMEEQFSQYMCESIRLQTAMVKADRKCTENYLEVTTESDKEAIKAIFEATVTDYIKKSKETIVKAVQAVINWIKEKVKMITSKLAEKVKVVTKKLKELDSSLVAAMDKVEVETIDLDDDKIVYRDEFKTIMSEIPKIVSSKNTYELASINGNYAEYIADHKWGDGLPSKDLKVKTEPYGIAKHRFEKCCTTEVIRDYAKDMTKAQEYFNTINKAINSIDPNGGELSTLKLTILSKVTRIAQHYIQPRLALRGRMVAYAIKGTMKAIALAPKYAMKKEATKESVSLLDDMLASI